jgi:hypothetical protein
MTIMNININFKFHPVGFGLFISGNIDNFKFVYDCGSRSSRRINECIENEFDEETNLDLIIISHFHQDHINGLEKLLKLVKSIDTIILPYITPKDRLIYLLSYLNDYKKPPSKWMESFIIDPAARILKGSSGKKIKNIVFIYGKSENYPESNNDKISENQKILENDNFSFDINDLQVSDEEKSIKENEGISDSKISIREHGLIRIKPTGILIPVWQFIFFYCKPSKRIIKYINEIIKEFDIEKGKMNKNNLAKIVKKGGLSTIANKISLAGDEINDTSLLLYHSPICLNMNYNFYNTQVSFQNQFKQECYYSTLSGGSRFSKHKPFKYCFCAYFYTGDVNLKTHYKEIQKYYKKSLLNEIWLLQVPHHGSEINWDTRLSKFNKGIIHIISSESSNKKGFHPSNKVLFEILKNDGHTLWCNEKHPIEIKGYIWFQP